jgi:hypothetical protein
MRDFILYILISAFLVSLLSVSTMAEEKDLEFHKKYNKQDNPINLWHFQISPPPKNADYPPSFLWYSARPYMDSTLLPVFGNRIYIKKNPEQ